MSDQSSIISISSHMAASDTDDGHDSSEYHVDTRKYVIPSEGHVRIGWPDKEQHSGQVNYISTSTLASTSTSTSTSREDTPLPGLQHRVNDHLEDQDQVAIDRGRNGTCSRSSGSSDGGSGSGMNGSDGATGEDDETNYVGPALSRPASIFSLSRVSLNSQLAELTSIKLPNAVSLSARIASMTTSAAAAKALCDSAEQIQAWIRNALKVIRGLDAEDDVEWAAAAGREGLNEVDNAIGRFEKVIKVYIFSVEELQMRPDIAALPKHDLMRNVSDMDAVLREWQKIKDSLGSIKNQVEIALDWEELWNHVLGAGIGQELDDLARLVFEMEEKRHQTAASDAASTSISRIDLDELGTMVEDRPRNPRHSLPPPFSPTLPLPSSPSIGNMEDSLLALFARMQPLRAALDFLPMRLSVFHCRGNALFPSACLALESRRDSLETQWKKLDADAESLRRELGEDRWLLVFRNAGRQAVNMCDSVSRTMDKLRIAVRCGEQKTDAPAIAKKIESYEAKKTHYAPAIDRVLAIIDRGVMDRLTLNGEILGLQSDMKRRWTGLRADMRDLDSTLLSMNVNMRNQQLRDSISTILSSEQSIASSFVETPRSSSASSVSGQSSLQYNNGTPKRGANRLFKSSIPRSVPSGARSSPLAQPLRPISPTLTPVAFLRQFKPPTDKPRWNGSTSTNNSAKGPSFSPFSIRGHSPNHASISPRSAPSKIPGPRSLSRAAEAQSPATPAPVRHVSSPMASPYAVRTPSSLGNRAPRSSNHSTLSHMRAFTTPVSARMSNFLTPTDTAQGHAGTEGDSVAKRFARSPSALAAPSGRKSSLLAPYLASDRSGRHSRADGRADDGKPRWK